MKCFILPSLLGLALLGSTVAIGPADLPECAQKCAANAAVPAGCSLSDIPCLCKNQSFNSATLQCSRSQCRIEDQSSASGILEEMCATVTTTTASSTPPHSTSSSTTSTTKSPTTTNTSPTTPPPRPQSSTSQTPATTTVTDSSPTTVTVKPSTESSTGTPGTTLVPAPTQFFNATTIVLSTMTALPTNNAALGSDAGRGVGFAAMLLGLAFL